jgi:hypothetical protein
LQIAAAPYLALFCFNTLINVTIILEPELPSGVLKLQLLRLRLL